MKLTVIIPARMSSTRFPGKPLVDILGIPMIEHVRRRVLLHSDVESAIVATCDYEIADVVSSFGGEVAMTDSSHFCCNDRVSEAASQLESDIIINVQGDEPLFNPNMLDYLINPMKMDSDISCTNLMTKITSKAEFVDKNIVKVVNDLSGHAMYMSREAIPSDSKGVLDYENCYKQLGVYAFKKPLLDSFLSWGPSPMEMVETVDMLRLLEHGQKVKMIEAPFDGVGVDTPKDLEVAIKLMKEDEFYGNY
jgi:3-deoxy-manno-octulosonate cytidylyltransferase (CMP-KDO synthetase)